MPFLGMTIEALDFNVEETESACGRRKARHVVVMSCALIDTTKSRKVSQYQGTMLSGSIIPGGRAPLLWIWERKKEPDAASTTSRSGALRCRIESLI